MSMLTQRQLFLNHVAQTSPAPMGLEIVRAEGVYLYDSSGKSYMDMISGIAVSSVGHRHPQLRLHLVLLDHPKSLKEDRFLL